MHGLLPHEVQDLTPHELALVLEGRRLRERERARLVAVQIATMINLWSSHKTSAEEIMGEATHTALDTPEAIEAALREDVERIERKEEREAMGWLDRLGLDGDAP